MPPTSDAKPKPVLRPAEEVIPRDQFLPSPSNHPLRDLCEAVNNYAFLVLSVCLVDRDPEAYGAAFEPFREKLVAMITHQKGWVEERSLVACAITARVTDATILHRDIIQLIWRPIPVDGDSAAFNVIASEANSLRARIEAATAIVDPGHLLLTLENKRISTSMLDNLVKGTPESRQAWIEGVAPGQLAKQTTLIAQISKRPIPTAPFDPAAKPGEPGDLITKTKAAEIAKCSERTIARLVKDTTLKDCGRGRVSRAEVLAKLDALNKRSSRPKKSGHKPDTARTDPGQRGHSK